jgi:GNAT superfamily N-acetyltransferase
VPTIAQFRAAILPHLGSPLTPEVAARLEFVACEPDDRVDLTQFEPLTVGEYTIAAEPFDDILDDLHVLHARHWQETEKYRHGLPLDPDYGAMSEDERCGRMVQFTVRHAGELVGNLRMYLCLSRHSGTPLAYEDTLYIAPEHRGGFLGVHVVRYVEAAMRALGVVEIEFDAKLVNRAGVILKRLRYEPVATKFVKVFPMGAKKED